MIGYAIREVALRKRIKRDAPGWLERADAMTSQMQAAGRYLDEAACWGEIKQIYMRLQHHKCGFCERKLAGGQRREHDIEHFRPKSRIEAYPDTLGFATGSAHPGGYHLLALHPLNYVVACKTCNSDWKKNYFPVAGTRAFHGTHPRDYAGERPYLVYPLGPLADDEPGPEQLITFDGFLAKPAIPREQDEHRHRVGLVTIHVLGLNEREGLLAERATILVQMFPLLDMPAPAARQALAKFTGQGAAHASCARAFEALYRRDPDRARVWFDGCRKYLKRLGRY